MGLLVLYRSLLTTVLKSGVIILVVALRLSFHHGALFPHWAKALRYHIGRLAGTGWCFGMLRVSADRHGLYTNVRTLVRRQTQPPRNCWSAVRYGAYNNAGTLV